MSAARPSRPGGTPTAPTTGPRGRPAGRLRRRGLADRPFGALSSGERQRVLLARSLWGDPGWSCSTSRRPGSTSAPGGPGGPPHPSRRRPDHAADGARHPPCRGGPAQLHPRCCCRGRAVAAGPIAEVLTAEALSELSAPSTSTPGPARRPTSRLGAPPRAVPGRSPAGASRRGRDRLISSASRRSISGPTRLPP